MSTGIRFHLQSATEERTIENLRSFVGEDASGRFGLLAGHERFMTTLAFGLCRFQIHDRPWQYLALPGGALYMHNDELYISTRRFFIDSDYQAISEQLRRELLADEENLRELKENLRHMEEFMFRRLWQLRRLEGYGRE